ncbi:MAG: hypothetical protein BWY11_02083 [Firmicutes bacterium ADurb.Bin182]|nr:MAG: hypothetical protein BWY11_02083 [Firmicutes bacterium ADurb.Bin182]
MYRKLLTKEFFKDNPYKKISAQRLVYSTLLYRGLENAADDVVLHTLSDERRENIAREKEIILAEKDPEIIFRLLRKNIEAVNRTVLINKALEFEAEILPMVAKKLVRNNHDTFIENAVRLLTWSKDDYTASLRERYSEFLSPYVQSVFCIVLGFRGSEDVIPWMMERFYEMKRRYPNENYDQGPLCALYELNARFYLS